MLVTFKQSLSAPILRCPTFREDAPQIKLERTSNPTVISNGSVSNVTVQDIIETRETGASSFDEGQILITDPAGLVGAVEFISLDPHIATVDQAGTSTRVSDGIARILVDFGKLKKRFDVDVSTSTPNYVVTGVSWVPGSSGEHAALMVDSRIAGKDMATHGRLFSYQDHVNDVYVRNPNCWAGDIDLSCISPSNSNANHRKAGVLVTPRHLVNAGHYPFGNGTKVYFVSMAGAIYERTVRGSVTHPDFKNLYPDLRLYTLDEDLPGDIKPCKILPSDWHDHLIWIKSGRPPALILDQEEKALVTDLYNLDQNARAFAHFSVPLNRQRLEFYEDKISGDSGNPAFLIFDLGAGPELLLLTALTFGGSGSGTFMTPHISTLNQMIVTSDAQAGVSTGYTLTEADLSLATSALDPDVDTFMSSSGASDVAVLNALSKYLKSQSLWEHFGIFPFASDQNFPGGTLLLGLGGITGLGLATLVGAPPRSTYGIDLTSGGFSVCSISGFENWTEGCIGMRFKPADAATANLHSKYRWWFGDAILNRYLATTSGTGSLSGETFAALQHDGATGASGSTTADWAIGEDMQEVTVFGVAPVVYKNKTPYVFDLPSGKQFTPAAIGYSGSSNIYLSAQYGNPSGTAQNTGTFNCIWFCSTTLTDSQREVITDLINLL